MLTLVLAGCLRGVECFTIRQPVYASKLNGIFQLQAFQTSVYALFLGRSHLNFTSSVALGIPFCRMELIHRSERTLVCPEDRPQGAGHRAGAASAPGLAELRIVRRRICGVSPQESSQVDDTQAVVSETMSCCGPLSSLADRNPSSHLSLADGATQEAPQDLPVTFRYYSSFDPATGSWTTGKRPARDLDLDSELHKMKTRQEVVQNRHQRGSRYSKKYVGDGYQSNILLDVYRNIPCKLIPGTQFSALTGAHSSWSRPTGAYDHARHPRSVLSACAGQDEIHDWSVGNEDEFRETHPNESKTIALHETEPRRTEFSHRSEALTLNNQALNSIVKGQLAIEGVRRGGDIPIPITRNLLENDSSAPPDTQDSSDRGRVVPISVLEEDPSSRPSRTKEPFKERVLYSRGNFISSC